MSVLPAIALRDASFSYGSEADPLFSGLTVQFATGFTGIVGANGSGKTTLLKAVAGKLVLSTGSREGPLDAVYCAQRTDFPPSTLYEFLEDWAHDACVLKSRLDVGYDYLDRWHCLSHGERKRAQIAHALWQSPSVLAIDEPTNHIDVEARQVLINALKEFRGIGVVVSHDRALLDELCSRCVWLDPPSAHVYEGAITQASQQRTLEHEASVRVRKQLLADRKQLHRAVAARREHASREHALRSKRRLSRKDRDARERIDRARVTDGNAGSALRQVNSKLSHLESRLESTHIKKTYTTGIWLGDAVSRRDAILRLTEGELIISEGRVLTWPELAIGARDRIAITGDNGTGKSVWINHIVPRINATHERVVYLPQETSAADARELLHVCQALPKSELGYVMSIVSRLNSRPEQLLDSQQPSPGEARKLALALGMTRQPFVIVMDEPTNHLDLPSLQALENALAECPCALIVVSHDHQFIANIDAEVWTMDRGKTGNSMLIV